MFPSLPVLQHMKPFIQWVYWALSLGVKQLEHESDYSPPSSARFRNVQSLTSISCISLDGMALRYMDSFIFNCIMH